MCHLPLTDKQWHKRVFEVQDDYELYYVGDPRQRRDSGVAPKISKNDNIVFLQKSTELENELS